jgi:6-phosphogluconolactonase
MSMLRRCTFVLIVFLAIVCSYALFGREQKARGMDSYLVYVGTYTGPQSKGIYAFRFTESSGKATPLDLVGETSNPSFVAVDAAGKHLYAVNEIGDYQGQKSGGVSAFEIDKESGKLKFLNEVASHGAGPCYVALDKTGTYVLVANYDGGSVAVFSILQDGRLGEASSVVQHEGHGLDKERQEGPHAHEIELSRDNRFAIASDLGLDKLLVYEFDAAKGSLKEKKTASGEVPPGAGPRHFVFHPNGKFVYALNEMGGSITQFSFNGKTGALQSLKTVSSLPTDFKGKNDSAEIEVHPSGKFLYASNRGPDNIAVFAIDGAKGSLTLVEDISTKGKTPRNFAIDPSGRYLFAANQESNNVVVFRIDPSSGRLTPTGQVLEVPSPVCVRFVTAN